MTERGTRVGEGEVGSNGNGDGEGVRARAAAMTMATAKGAWARATETAKDAATVKTAAKAASKAGLRWKPVTR